MPISAKNQARQHASVRVVAPRHLGALVAAAAAGALLLAAGTLPPAVQTAVAASNSKPSQNRTMYRWRDRNGNLQTGDSIPPEYATQDVEVLNSKGVVISIREGARTPAQREAAAAKAAVEEAARRAVAQQRQRDQNLLATYLTVEEIQLLRDRRVDLIDSQIRVATSYLENLRARLAKLQATAASYRPYSPRADANPMPDGLAEDLVRTMNDVRTQDRNLQAKRLEMQQVRADFERDIARFKELKRLEKDYGPGGYLHIAPEATRTKP